jgi:hypothetical protein
MSFPCRSTATTLLRPCHCPAILRQCRTRAGRPHSISGRPTLIHTYYAIPMPLPCRDPAVALRGRFQNGIFVAWQGNGIACVNETRQHCVNQMGNTQFKPLGERHGMCEFALRLRSAAVRLLGLRVEHGCLSLEKVECCQVHSSPTECGVSECDHEASTMMRPWPLVAFATWREVPLLEVQNNYMYVLLQDIPK